MIQRYFEGNFVREYTYVDKRSVGQDQGHLRQKHCRYGLFTWNKHLFCQRETDSFSLKVTLLKFWNMQISIHAREKLIYIRPLVKNMNSTNNILECHRKKIKVMQSEGILSHLLQDEYVYLRSLCFIIYNGFGNYW